MIAKITSKPVRPSQIAVKTPSTVPKTSLKKWWDQRLLYGIVALVILVIDQLTKAGTFLMNSRILGFPGIITLHSVTNDGAAFSLGRGYAVSFLVIAALVVGFLTFYIWRLRPRNTFILMGAGLIAGGAIGNALDRIFRGSVLDFISLDCIHFPVFNIADAAITCGFSLILIIALRHGIDVFFPQAQRKQYKREHT